ncbi:hypothetical protein [Chitinimonas lacunae]|uniref:DUF1493 family protein n=1 Tax=Chitinimonas lacunae TaxID=1963018 RepID=A0ABV8MLI7_9NEIS
MHFSAIESFAMTLEKPVGALARAYLKALGYDDSIIETWTEGTRLLHDLGICGDSIVEDLEVLHRKFGVDLTSFNVWAHFPSELSMDALLALLLPIERYLRGAAIVRRFDKIYPPVSLRMIEDAIANGRLVD